ncbi:MAG: polysaccharide biosynthesis protein [Legionellaceae bacterium]|nr:polysaccharide biosynthesis protein [Legionellaceae bacterium]
MDKKTYLITGGTGSFGHKISDHLLAQDVAKEIRIFSRDEAKQDLMRTSYQNDERVKFYIGDVRNAIGVREAMHGVDYVFHAAALKQVPSCEFFPMEALKTNVEGSENVIRAAVAEGVKHLVCLSTDKAVYPINAMGMSKALMEKVAQAYARKTSGEETIISCVRYGNVMCSRGSVIPRFIQQIKTGQAITITEPSMTRFMMALSEAVDLVEYAFNNARQGDLFVKKAPACTILELAHVLKEMFNSSVEINNIGVRHGEKLFETLASKEELVSAEDMGDYFRVQLDNRDLNYKSYFSEGSREVSEIEDYHSHNTYRLEPHQIKQMLLELPEVQKEL